jgi:hypothetical protein
MGVSSTAKDTTVKVMPASRRISARRGEEEARISFMAKGRQEYYRERLSSREDGAPKKGFPLPLSDENQITTDS